MASMRLRPVTSDNACLVEWRASFKPAPRGRGGGLSASHGSRPGRGPRGLRRAIGRGRLACARRPHLASWAKRRCDSGALGWRPCALQQYPKFSDTGRPSIRAPGAGEARLLADRHGVNFIDIYCRRGGFHLVAPGGVLGMEAAGVVESTGAGVAPPAGRPRRLRLRAARRLRDLTKQCARTCS